MWPHRRATRIGEPSAATHCDGHGAHAMGHLLGDERLPVRPTGKQLDALRTALVNAAFGLGNEQLDAQHLLATGHAQNRVHPRADPLERLGVR